LFGPLVSQSAHFGFFVAADADADTTALNAIAAMKHSPMILNNFILSAPWFGF
jgi:hypothetical protein